LQWLGLGVAVLRSLAAARRIDPPITAQFGLYRLLHATLRKHRQTTEPESKREGSPISEALPIARKARKINIAPQ
jgi:hypothetical protein